MWSMFAVGLALGVLTQIRILQEQRLRSMHEWSSIPVKVPDSVPELGQESVDAALILYRIRVPDTAQRPVYNPLLRDRGLAIRQIWHMKIRIEVGPDAFASWGLLGSTLGHELEIHANQNWPLINLMDMIGLNGSMWAERQAYLYEIKQSARFGLTRNQSSAIKATLAYYYDIDTADLDTPKSKVEYRLGRWLARSSMLNY
jgi:hypothetical protein